MSIHVYMYVCVYIYIYIWVDDLPAPWCFLHMQRFAKPGAFTESEGSGSQNLELSQHLNVEVPKT